MTAPAEITPRFLRAEDPQTLLLGALGCLSVALAWWLSTRPMVDGDSLAFRLPTIATWYQTGSFTMLDQYWFFAHYPYDWELLCSLFVFPFGEDFLVALPNLFAWALLGLAVYSVAVEVGAGDLQSLSSAALVLSLPSLLTNVDTMHNDLALAAFFMAAMYLGLRYLRTGSPAYLGLTLVALGLLVGVKTSGLVYAALIVIPMIVWRLRAPRRAGSVRLGAPLTLAGICCLLLTGGFWYVRNLVQVGNPLGYATVQIGHLVVFPGRLGPDHFRRTMIASLFEPTNPAHWKILASQVYGEFHLPLIVLALLALLAVPALAVKRKPISNAPLLAALGLVMVTAVLYALTPYSGDNGENQWRLTPSFVGQALRYAFPFCACLGVAAAGGATALRMPWGILTAAALLCIELRLAGSFMLYPLAGFVCAWVLIRVLRLRIPRPAGSRPASILAFAVALLALVPGGYVAREVRDTHRAQLYGPMPEVLRTCLPAGAPVGYLMSHRSYLLYGKDLRRHVVYVPLDSGDPRSMKDWVSLLHRRHVSMVAVGPLGPQWESSSVLRSMDAPGSPFKCLVRTDPATYPVLYELTQ